MLYLDLEEYALRSYYLPFYERILAVQQGAGRPKFLDSKLFKRKGSKCSEYYLLCVIHTKLRQKAPVLSHPTIFSYPEVPIDHLGLCTIPTYLKERVEY